MLMLTDPKNRQRTWSSLARDQLLDHLLLLEQLLRGDPDPLPGVVVVSDDELPDLPVVDGSAAIAGPLRNSIVRPATNRTAVRFMRVTPYLKGWMLVLVRVFVVQRAYQASRIEAGQVEGAENAREVAAARKAHLRRYARIHRNSYTGSSYTPPTHLAGRGPRSQ